jgi:hypothetical protein
MRIIEPGHIFELDHIDGKHKSKLKFVSRVGDLYPGNTVSHEGTNMQEVMRALISRARFLNDQIPCAENTSLIHSLRQGIVLLESRAAQRHSLTDQFIEILDESVQLDFSGVEDLPTCKHCGHLTCKQWC